MFELKKYQKRSIIELDNYLVAIKEFHQSDNFKKAFISITDKGYQEHNFQCPFVCIKIPTGGGKTIVACHMLHSLFEKFLERKDEQGLVIWLVPTDAIRSQTIDALKNREHPYREVLDHHFSNNIKILNFKEALKIKKSDIEDNLCILVATVGAFRITDKDGRKAYADNGELLEHFSNVNAEFLDKYEEGDVKNSLMNVIKLANPIIVVDEGHNVKTMLSLEMLKNMNPSVILEYTATPKPESNVLVNVTTAELKEEKMVKIPIFLSNIAQWQQTIRDGVVKRKELEKIADKERGEYIRPIALLQAEQEKEDSKKIYVQKIKDFLIDDCKISEEEIAIKTGTQDQISGLDLFSKDSPIRYIITVSALKEGWDNNFAYVLISVANLGARIAVEQTIGRILRLPKAKEKKHKELNVSYVFTSSRNFREAASNLEKGLLANGYTPQDYRELSDKIEIDNKFKRQFNDEIKIPYISIKNDKRKISYYEDLIGEDFDISKQPVMKLFDTHYDQDRLQKIDVREGDKLEKSFQTKLNVVYPFKDFSKENLLNWLDKKVVRKEYSQSEKREYLQRTIDSILKSKKTDLTEISVNCYKLRDDIIAKINEIEFGISKSTFDEFEKKGILSTKEVLHEFNDKLEIDNFIDGEDFKFHLYEKAGTMNNEELDFAQRIDITKNIAWWFRNREKKDFFIQGWQKDKFYPDFIVKTKSGNYLMVEYKGAHLLETPDTIYKKELGAKWAEMAGINYHFFLVDKTSVNKFMNDLEKL